MLKLCSEKCDKSELRLCRQFSREYVDVLKRGKVKGYESLSCYSFSNGPQYWAI